MADSKKKRSFKDLVKGSREGGMDREMAHRMLELNPALRETHDTGNLMDMVDAMKTGDAGPAPQKTKKTDKEVALSGDQVFLKVSQARDFYSAVLAAREAISTKMEEEVTSHEKAISALDQEMAALGEQHERQMAQCKAEVEAFPGREQALGAAALDALIERLLIVDPDMVSSKTRSTLTREKRFLDGLGFSAKKVLERQRKEKG